MSLKSVKKIEDTDVFGKEKKFIGPVRKVLIDGENFFIRYMFLSCKDSTGTERNVLISPAFIVNTTLEQHYMLLRFSKQTVMKGPDTNINSEEEIYEYYNCTPYWHGNGTWGRGNMPEHLFLEKFPKDTQFTRDFLPNQFLGHLAHVNTEDYIFNKKTWQIHFVISNNNGSQEIKSIRRAF